MEIRIAKWRDFPHILRTQQFSYRHLLPIFELVNAFIERRARGEHFTDIAADKCLLSLFYQPSTRTASSFYRAAVNIGMQCIEVRDPKHTSSEVKGEDFQDTIRTYCGPTDPFAFRIADGMVIRHATAGKPQLATEVSNVPVINGGDGKEQHPTQAILDAYAIWKAFGKLERLHVGLVGDLTGRASKSLAYLLAKCGRDIRFSFYADEAHQMPQDVLEYLKRHGVRYEMHTAYGDTLNSVDVLNITRCQTDLGSEQSALADQLRFRAFHLDQLRETARVYHPLPIDASPGAQEIASELWNSARRGFDPRLAWFTGQCDYNVPVRMALLAAIFGNNVTYIE